MTAKIKGPPTLFSQRYLLLLRSSAVLFSVTITCAVDSLVVVFVIAVVVVVVAVVDVVVVVVAVVVVVV